MTRDVNQSVLTAHLAAERQFDMKGTLATLHPGCTFVDEPLGLRYDGRDGASRYYDLWWTAFRAAPESWPLTSTDTAVGAWVEMNGRSTSTRSSPS